MKNKERRVEMSGGNGEQKLSKKQLRELKKMLEDKKGELEGDLNLAVAGCDQHCDIADRANKESEVRFSIREKGRKREELAQINLALERMKKGTYGQCQHPDCESGHISFLRLRAIPTAPYCLTCQCESEGRKR
ncbi:TraR/DksA family transcriptional regulator [Candidatus Falkowbacteria bacterium]|nr:TraR/DksA family transcriptional regulator [Candidatus Falkowbacteria bacterium]